MHEMITHYVGSPTAQRWWWVIDEAEAERRRVFRDSLPEPRLEWDRAPDEATLGRVEELRIIAHSDDLRSFPPYVGRLRALRYLEFPMRFVASLTPGVIPASVEVLHVTGSGTGTVPLKMSLPQVRFLLSNTGILRFKPENFPALARLSLELDRPQKMLATVAGCSGVSALQLSSLHASDAFERLAALPLEYLGIAGGKVASIQGIGVLAGLRSLNLKSLSALEHLAGLEKLSSLEELSIGYCRNLRGVRELTALPALRRLVIYGCGDIGAREIRAEMERKGLEKLSWGDSA
jgi:hypothetical protein